MSIPRFSRSQPALGWGHCWFGALALAAFVLGGTNVMANLPPKVALVQPAMGAVFYNPAEIQIIVEAADADGYVRTVEVFTDAGSLGSVTPNPAAANPVNPFQWTWLNPGAGDHKLVARATDNEGSVTYSDSLVITVKRDSSSTGATLTIVKPADGDTFASNAAVVAIELTAIDPLADIRHVEFFANDLSIGRSDQWTKDAVIPGRPREHYLNWKPLEGGNYVLTARAQDSQGYLVKAPPVAITVAPQLPVVSILASVPETAEPSPTVRIRPGAFTVTRSGPTTNALTVFLAYDGSATPGADYETLPSSVTIPAGAASTELLVAPVEDSLAEGIETVGATLVDPPFDHLPDQVIDPEHNAAKVVIYDSGSGPNATLEITAPKEGESFNLGQPITINATALDPLGYIASVEFFDGDSKIGASQIMFFRAPDPGTPIYHTLEWKAQTPGEHTLTTRAVDSQGHAVVSNPVHIKVANDGGLASLEITAPKDGEVFKPGAPITINVTAIDPAGYIASVEFFDADTQIGVSQLAFFRAPDPGTPIYHTFEWPNAAPGTHALTARAVDTLGNRVMSKAVSVQVGGPAAWPNVQVIAIDPEAIEVSPLVLVIDPAQFLISRDGDLSQDLYVVYSLHGTATPGKDYTRLDRFARIPAGQSEVTVNIVPLPDDLTEPMETVALRLEDPMPISSLPVPPTPYLLPDWGREAVAVIYDHQPPAGGGLELAFPSEGESYPSNEPLTLIAAAYHPTAVISHVDFYAADTLIGSSDTIFNKPPTPGLAVHRFLWKAPTPGPQIITARAALPDGTVLVSAKVQISIQGPAPGPVVTLLAPQSGAVFGPADTVEISAATRDPNGPVQRLDILLDDQLLDSTKASELTVKATDLKPGPHVIVARAIDSQGAETQSSPVKILVWDSSTAGGGGSAPNAELKQIARQSSGTVRLQLASPANGLCLLEVSTDLVNWVQVPPIFLPDGNLIIEEDPKNSVSRRFYRTRIK